MEPRTTGLIAAVTVASLLLVGCSRSDENAEIDRRADTSADSSTTSQLREQDCGPGLVLRADECVPLQTTTSHDTGAGAAPTTQLREQDCEPGFISRAEECVPVRTSTSEPARGASARNISRDTWPGEWPFTVDGVYLMCLEGGTYDGAVAVANGEFYSLNGTARQIDPLIVPSDSIRLRVPGGVGLVPIDEVRERALELC